VSGQVLVTGATGLVGGHVVRQLLEQGRSVRVLVRAPDRLVPELRARVRVVQGDLAHGPLLAPALAGVDTVLHLAACARAWCRDPAEFEAVNIRAVDHLLAAAAAARVRRVVHVSTVLTLPMLRPAAGTRAATPYETTKLEGERLVDAWAAAGHDAVAPRSSHSGRGVRRRR
jgi:nucleoside-diphosphate-sugar epimerase